MLAACASFAHGAGGDEAVAASAAEWHPLAALVALCVAWLWWMLLRTTRERRELAAREAQARAEHARSLTLLQAIAESSPDAIFAKDLEGRYLLFNRAGASLVGRSADQVLGRDDHDLFPAEQAEANRVADQQVVEHGSIETYEEELDTVAGRLVFHTVKGPLRNADGQVIGIFGIARDVTERRREEEQLRQLRMAVQQSSESIVITDLAANIVYANEAALASSGYSADELLGANSRILQSGLTPRETYAALWGELTAGRPWRGHLFNRRKDGRHYVESAVITPIRMPHGRITHYLAVKEDVTEKRRMSEELERHRLHLEELVEQRTAELALAKQAAESANAAKSAFLATMSHEIRTPMNGVVGLADVLRQSPLTPYQGDLVDTIRESSLALLAILDDLLDFSKIEAGRLVLEHEPVDLRALVEGTCDMLQPGAATQGVELRVFVDPRLPARVTGDALHLRQILANLVGNAIKFSAGPDRPGRVMVRAEPDPAAAATGVRFSVIDNGIGMSAEVQQRIFAPFVQAESSTTRRYGGTGLGLTIVHRLTQAFGGSIAMSSQVGAGTRFHVTLPLAAAHDGADPPPPAHDLSGLHAVLLLGDDPSAPDWQAVLDAAGARTHVAPSLAALPAVLGRAMASRPGEVVVLAGVGLEAAMQARVQGVLDEDGHAVVWIGRGQRRRAQWLGPGQAGVDADALHAEALVTAVALAAGRALPGLGQSAVDVRMHPHSPAAREAAADRGHRVLVAEDNHINQQVICRQLELLGLAHEVADDGEQALRLWRRGGHALLLTDLHMPGLDGFALTAAIRAEQGDGPRLPIVALTANALYGEAERCRAAGMDDYLSKPVTRERLAEVLSRWLGSEPPATAAAGDPPPAAPPVATVPLLDEAMLPSLIGDEPEMIEQIRREYLEATLPVAAELRSAGDAADWPRLADEVHRLKSSSRAVGAMALGDLCERVEASALQAEVDELPALLGELLQMLGAVRQLLQSRLDGTATPSTDAVPESDPLPAVLIVDDDAFQRQILVRQLKQLGVGPVEALASGAQVLERLKGHDGARMLLMTDLSMPGMDGIELMRRLAGQGFSGGLALISAVDERLLESGARLAAEHRLNVVCHLHKPVSPQALRDALQRWQGHMPAPQRRRAKVYGVDELRRALAEREVRVHYQPKLLLADGGLVGVEALVRWQHPADGLVYPDSFIETVEQHGLIDALTDVVLDLSLAQAAAWRLQGLRPRVAVNVSMDNLVGLDFPERVLERVAAHGLEPGDLMLEVTESRLMQDLRSALDILTRLRLHGIGLAIDDFGTGHSSLAQLRDLPFDELKIDRGFVHGSTQSATQRAIVAASIEMAHQLGMRTVAEGVEDSADWNAVRAAGCDIAQGWHIARPMPGPQLAEWLAQRRAVAG